MLTSPGEGALLALGGAAVGIATDLGMLLPHAPCVSHASHASDTLAVGSSRIPAAFNGLAALKTCEGRLSTSGIATIVSGHCRLVHMSRAHVSLSHGTDLQ